MKHNLKTLLKKMEHHSIETNHHELTEIIEELQQLKQNASILVDTLNHPIRKSECYHQGEVDAYNEILGENQ